MEADSAATARNPWRYRVRSAQHRDSGAGRSQQRRRLLECRMSRSTWHSRRESTGPNARCSCSANGGRSAGASDPGRLPGVPRSGRSAGAVGGALRHEHGGIHAARCWDRPSPRGLLSSEGESPRADSESSAGASQQPHALPGASQQADWPREQPCARSDTVVNTKSDAASTNERCEVIRTVPAERDPRPYSRFHGMMGQGNACQRPRHPRSRHSSPNRYRRRATLRRAAKAHTASVARKTMEKKRSDALCANPGGSAGLRCGPGRMR